MPKRRNKTHLSARGRIGAVVIRAPGCGGFVVQMLFDLADRGEEISRRPLAAFSTKTELLAWLNGNLAEPAKEVPTPK